jgi:hypothetical protein
MEPLNAVIIFAIVIVVLAFVLDRVFIRKRGTARRENDGGTSAGVTFDSGGRGKNDNDANDNDGGGDGGGGGD